MEFNLAKEPNEAEKFAADILGMEIKGFPVRKILIDEAVSIRAGNLSGNYQ